MIHAPASPHLTESVDAITLNEIYYNSPGADTGSFIEIKGPPNASLDGYRVAIFNASNSNAATISLAGRVIPSSGYFVIAQDSAVSNVAMLHTAANLVNGSQ